MKKEDVAREDNAERERVGRRVASRREKKGARKDFVGALDKFSAIGSFDADSPSRRTPL